MPSTDPLLQPFTLKHLTLRNRIMSSAHEPAYTDEGMPKDRYRLYHVEKAKGGIGLTMIGGSSVVAPDSPQAFGNILLYKDEVVRWLSELADDVHSHGAAVMIQMTHLGRRTSWSKDDWLPVIAPSYVREPAHRAFPKVMEDWDITRVIAAYADAAERIKASGLDGLEIECYGHLIDQFWSPATNQRDDEYGGVLANRTRFAFEVLRAIRDRVGPEFIVGVRMVCDEDWERGLNKREGLAIAQQPRRLRPDRLRQRHPRPHRHRGSAFARHSRHGRALRAASRIRRRNPRGDAHSDLPRRANPGRRDRALRDRGRQARPRRHDPRASRRPAYRAQDHGGPRGRNPPVRRHGLLHRQHLCRPGALRPQSLHGARAVDAARDRAIRRAVEEIRRGRRRPRRTGSGAGRGRARVTKSCCSRRATSRAARSASPRGSRAGAKSWASSTGASRNARKYDVELRTSAFAEAAEIEQENPDVVVIATGGVPNLGFLDEGEDLATTSWDVLTGAAKLAGSVIVYDDNGAHPGVSVAEFAARAGAKVEFVTPERSLAPDVGATSFPPYLRAFSEFGVAVTLNLRLERIRREGNRLVGDVSRRIRRQADREDGRSGHRRTRLEARRRTLFRAEAGLAQSRRSRLPRADRAAAAGGRARTLEGAYQLYRIGDAVSSRNIHAAIYDALRLIRTM